MKPGNSSRRGVRICAAALAGTAILTCAVAPASAAAAERRGGGELSPRLAELARPSFRSASRARQADRLSLAVRGPGSLLREGNRVLVEVRFERGAAAAADDLRAAGAKVLAVSPRYQTITVAARPDELRRLAGAPGVEAATEVLAPVVNDARPASAAATPCFGAVTSEGDTQLNAARARAEFEVDGGGETVGVLSDSFDQDPSAPRRQAEDVASGDLPGPGNPCGETTPVDVLSDFSDPESSDEGRAMAQIVHDLAPGAALSFATAFTGLGAFAANVKALAAAGASTIVDDVSYFEEPFFQEGPVGVAVTEVSAAGVSYFSSAGNNNLISGGKDIASWEAPQFRDAGGCPSGAPGYAAHCMDFDPGGGVDSTFGVRVSAGATLRVDLQWAQPWNGVTTDLDAYLLNSGNQGVAASEGFNVTGTQRPFEFLVWTNTTGAAQTMRIAINRCDLVCDGSGGGDEGTPRLKLALLQNGGGVTESEYPESGGGDTVGPTIFGHNGAGDAVSVGAIRYTTNSAPESFSSRGPVTHYFGPVEGATPAAALGSPEVLAKPDLVATDGGANTFFGSCVSDVWRFFGTSAAAPHAAAVAALEREASPAATAGEVNQAQRDGAATVGAFGANAVGAGLLDAVAAIEGLGVSPAAPGALPEPAPAPVSCLPTGPEVGPEPEPTPQPAPGPQPAPDSGSESSAPREVTADRFAPRTFFRKRLAGVVRTRRRTARVVIRFGSNEAGVTFLCKVDRGRFHRCPARFVRRYRLGRHVVRVKARDAAGNVDRTPAIRRFRVKRVRRASR